ncbi:MAG: M23 family metallopeptidase [Bacteroidetes bacterium]|nr:M23 family metallopeptidase [Bacteroidota bacterium]
MKISDRIRNYIDQLREKHKLTYIDDTTYHEKWSFNVSSLSLISLVLVYTLVIVLVVMVLFRYTSLNNFVNPYDNDETRSLIEKQSQSIDSLYAVTGSNEKYLDNLKKLLNDEPFDDSISLRQQDTTYLHYTPDFSKSREDSLLREKVERDMKGGGPLESGYAIDFFFPPVNGRISQSFNSEKDHFGVDVVTAADEPIKACLDGTVIVSGWIPGEGNILIIQHNNDFISVYKHCSVLLREQGDKILTGDPVGIVGNTGENTSGPHLHFELWQKGNALNPQEFISF